MSHFPFGQFFCKSVVLVEKWSDEPVRGWEMQGDAPDITSVRPGPIRLVDFAAVNVVCIYLVARGMHYMAGW